MTNARKLNMAVFSESQPLVSILIPAYNHETYIEEVLNNYLNLKYDNFELLILDDGSTDKTLQVIEAWVQKYKHKINVSYWTQKNKGCSATLNALIKKSKGNLIIPTASDDYLLPDSVEKLVLLSKIFPDKYYYFGDGIVIDDSGKKIKNSILADLNKAHKHNYHLNETLAEEFISRWSLGGPLGMFRAEFFHDVYFYDENLVIQDWDLYLKLVAENKAVFIDIPVCAYRVHNTSTCRTGNTEKRIKNLQDQCLVAQRNQPLFQGRLKSLLKREELLLKAKISFLQRHIIKLFFQLSSYFIFSFFIYLKKLYNQILKSNTLRKDSHEAHGFAICKSKNTGDFN